MRRAVLVCGCLLTSATSLSAGEELAMRVSPLVALAPALLRVQTIVPADADNRTLVIIAESSDFFRSSQIPLDGQYAPHVSVFEFPGLPAGLYAVTGILGGTHCERAKVFRRVTVLSSAGAQ